MIAVGAPAEWRIAAAVICRRGGRPTEARHSRRKTVRFGGLAVIEGGKRERAEEPTTRRPARSQIERFQGRRARAGDMSTSELRRSDHRTG